MLIIKCNAILKYYKNTFFIVNILFDYYINIFKYI